jgi:hypothetical protein
MCFLAGPGAAYAGPLRLGAVALPTVLRSSGVRFTLAVFIVELAVRLALIHSYPDNFSMDAYQRWGGREHLLVQDWLPATQSIIWLVSAMGGGVLAMRVAMAVIGALAITAGAWVARSLGGAAAGWLFIPVGLFGPFLTWSVVPYQEGSFLLALFGGMALALQAQQQNRPATDSMWRWADAILGLLPLVRYEGWPVAIIYIIWRRDRKALWALWGAAVWLGVKTTGIEGHASSPVSYADWEGLSTRFDPSAVGATLSKLWTQMLDTKGALLLPLGLIGLVHQIRVGRRGAILLGLVLAGQLAALAGWVVGLETATYRMQAVPGVLLGLFAAGSAGLVWSQGGRTSRALLALTGLIAVGAFIPQGFNNAHRSTRSVRWERRLVESMEDCETCTYLVKPRTGLGTRDRHDGCEIIQGLGVGYHGEKFWCQKWGDVPADYQATHAARWRKGGYVIRDARDVDR